MNNFNYSKIYYKVTSKDENHRDFQYKDGLNIDIIPFNDNPNASCVPGGLYFTDLEHVIKFFGYGCWIREVKIPKDAEVIEAPSGNKWRADKIILGRKYSFEEYFKKLWNPEKVNWNYSHYLAVYCSEYFERWWNPEKFDWYWSEYLARYCSRYFKIWWNPEKFDWAWSEYLARYCSRYFKIWWNPEEFDWAWSHYLAEYCSEYKNIWEKDRENI